MQKQETWEEKFDNSFITMSPLNGFDIHNPPILYAVEFGKIENIKNFITTLLKEETERVKEEIITKINKLKDKVETATGSFKYSDQYDDCINIINKII